MTDFLEIIRRTIAGVAARKCRTNRDKRWQANTIAFWERELHRPTPKATSDKPNVGRRNRNRDRQRGHRGNEHGR